MLYASIDNIVTVYTEESHNSEKIMGPRLRFGSVHFLESLYKYLSFIWVIHYNTDCFLKILSNLMWLLNLPNLFQIKIF